MATRDYYEILGVGKSASDKELKAAYRKLALQWHPDRNKSQEAEKRFKEVNEAYEVLSNPQKKAAYDQYGHAAFSQGAGAGQGPFGGFSSEGGPFRWTYSTNYGGGQFEGVDFSDPFEIFEQFFGGASPFGRASRSPRVALEISFEEAYKGVEKEVEIGGRRRRIKIPPGVDDGSQIRFADFSVVVRVRPHKIFQREGVDLIAEVYIPLVVAIAGGKVEVPTIDGRATIRVKPGTESGTTIRLSGYGMPRLRGRGRGDYYIRLRVQIPARSHLTYDQQRVLEELKR